MILFYNGVFDTLTYKLFIKLIDTSPSINKVLLVKSGNYNFTFNRPIELVELDYNQLFNAEYPISNTFYKINEEERDFLKNESIKILFMIGRMHRLQSHSFMSRYEILMHHIKGATSLINKHQPNYFVFTNMPHEVYDYVFFKIAEFRNLNRCYLMHGMQMETYYQVLNSIEGNDPQLENYTEESENLNNPEILKILKKYEDIDYEHFYMSPDYEPLSRRYRGIKKYLFKVEQHLRFTLKAINQGVFLDYILNHLILYNLEKIRINQLLKKYSLRSFQTKKKILYIPLNYQPELTTSPMGGDFFDQLEMIELISRNCPDSFVIYVKDHPKQRKNFGRNYNFYKKLINLKNVYLLDYKTPNSKIFKQCELVATVSGTVGFEAICSGKFALVFGEPFYMYFDRAFKINNDEDFISFISNYSEFKKFDIKNLHRFLNKCQKQFLYGFVDMEYMHLSNLNIEENVNTVVNNIKKEIKL